MTHYRRTPPPRKVRRPRDYGAGATPGSTPAAKPTPPTKPNLPPTASPETNTTPNPESTNSFSTANLNLVRADDVRDWLLAQHAQPDNATAFGLAGRTAAIGLPVHLQEVHAAGEDIRDFASLPFYSFCYGLLLPLCRFQPQLISYWFGLPVTAKLQPKSLPPREAMIDELLRREVGLSVKQKLACLIGDPFYGAASTIRHDTLLRLITANAMAGRRGLLDRLAQVGDISLLFAENRSEVRSKSPLTTAEVLAALFLVPKLKLNRKLALLRSLLLRCGKLEAYMLSRLLLGKHGPGFGITQPMLLRGLARKFAADLTQLEHAASLTDIYKVGEVLETEGIAGLKKIQLQPLSAVRPALAGGTAEQIDAEMFPCWVERKYDGIRFLLHKSTDRFGSMLTAAYTRNGNDWLERVAGLDATIKRLPCRDGIIDGELYGVWQMLENQRPATVYEVMQVLSGEPLPVRLKFVAFDVLYLNGVDQTRRSLRERQVVLNNLLAMTPHDTPISLAQAGGQLVESMADVNRLYAHFRAQGHEGVIVKQLDGPYRISARDPSWLKRKELLTLDVILMGATFTADSRHQGKFGSYVMGVLDAAGNYLDLGDVDGVDQLRDLEIQRLIHHRGLLTGRRIERKLTEGTRAGVELHPHLVATVAFQEITRESDEFRLRHPRIKVIRSDKSVNEADTLMMLTEMYQRQRLS